MDDARGDLVRHLDLVDPIVELPAVTDSWTGGVGIAKVEGDNAFLGIVAGPTDPTDIVKPLVLEGRLPGASGDGDVIEIALRDDFQRSFDVPMGTEIPVRFLTEDDYFRFDTGFEGGAPHGAELVVRVVGTFRMAGGTSTVPPGLAGPDALRDHPDEFIGGIFFARLAGGRGAVDAFTDEVADLAGGRHLPPEAREFVVATVEDTSVAAAAVDNTADLLGRALLALALAAIVVGGFAVWQALARHHTASASTREVEQALGLTRSQQAGARLLSGALPTAIAMVLTLAGSVATAGLEPIGGIDLYEPSPGFALNAAVVGLGVVIAGAFVSGRHLRHERAGTAKGCRQLHRAGERRGRARHPLGREPGDRDRTAVCVRARTGRVALSRSGRPSPERSSGSGASSPGSCSSRASIAW